MAEEVTMKLLRPLLCALSLAPVQRSAWAQAVAGSQVSGVVRDSSGGVLPGVEVTITKTDTGTPRTVHRPRRRLRLSEPSGRAVRV